MPVIFLSAICLVGTFASFVQVGGMSEGGMRAMGTGMMLSVSFLACCSSQP